MSPLLGPSATNEELMDKKYVRVRGQIAYADNGLQHHVSIAYRYFPDAKISPEDKPVVDDTGTITLYKEKLYFTGMPPVTCKIKTELNEAREKTKEVASTILGTERVG